jgi:subtilase family serine protease
MIAHLLVALLAPTAEAAGVPPSDRVDGRTPVHLAIVLAPNDMNGLRAFLAEQRDPRSPNYRRFLSPQGFGERFGQPEATYGAVANWLASGGFSVESFPNHLFLGATGTVANAESLFAIQLRNAVDARGRTFHAPSEAPHIPPEIAPLVLALDGLDNHLKIHPRLTDSFGDQVLGPQDLRRFYDIVPLLARGITGQTAHLAVLGPQLPPSQMPSVNEIVFFLQNLSNSTADVIFDVLPNPSKEYADEPGWHAELEGDVELQTVAAPGAASITLVLSPLDEVYTTGVNELVSNFPQLTAVSVSFGLCESQAQSDGGTDLQAVEALVSQGVAEGQTWFGAAGDNGADDCGDGSGPAVDFPASIPEIVACGGTQAPMVFDSNNAIPDYVQEVVWNNTGNMEAGAGGGGISSVFAKPSWQVGVYADDGGRDMPDISLVSGNWLAVANGPSVGVVEEFAGTSDSAPLAAGIFALVSEAVGCRLGLIQPDLYELGKYQFDGGAVVFHDVVTGDNSFDGVTGYNAKPGFDLASGWGSFDVAALAAAWPPCPGSAGFPLPDAGPRVPYDPCPVCGVGLYCELSSSGEGPAACKPLCPADAGPVMDAGRVTCLASCRPDASDCPAGRTCQPLGAEVSLCMPACRIDFDCDILPGTACDVDAGVCVPNPQRDAGPDGGGGGVYGSACGCQGGAALPESTAALALLALFRLRRK